MINGFPYNYDTLREDVAVVSYLKSQLIGRDFQGWLWQVKRPAARKAVVRLEF
jgi:hypothetical protein